MRHAILVGLAVVWVGSAAHADFAASADGKRVADVLKAYFEAPPEKRADVAIPADLDTLLLAHAKTIRAMAWQAYRNGWEPAAWKARLRLRYVEHGNLTMRYTIREVGKKPEGGWPIVIAMHGGGASKHANDRSWGHMQTRYKAPPEYGYIYVVPRAPTDGWNGFYMDGNLVLTDRLLRQLHATRDTNTNRVYMIGYSHGGYGAFYQGMKLADRFAHVHASSAAPTEYDACGLNLRNTHFTFMIDESDRKHGRKDRCVWFDKWIQERRGDRTDIYPVKMEMMRGFGHGRLPDHWKIKDMYPHVRTPLPEHVSWFAWPGVHYMNWLYAPAPRKNFVEADRKGNAVTLKTQKINEVHVLLDERMIDPAKPVTVDANGTKTTVAARPSLRTLCELLAARGDPEYAFTIRIPVKTGP